MSMSKYASRADYDKAKAASEGLGAWVSTDERLPHDGQSLAFVVRASNRLEYLNGKVLGGYYRAGPFGGFGVPGMTVDTWCWMPLPAAPAVPEVAASA